MNNTEYWRLSASEMADAIASRSISSREIVRSCMDRIGQVNPALNALVDVREDEALRAADTADAAVARGETLGPLHGVPVSTKVNVDQKGYPTTNGVVAFREVVATEDSPVVANLRKSGAVLLGRSNTPAFSFRWFTDNDLHGQTLNPHDRSITPGGSSGGAGAAVATGMSAIGQGNDQGGSVRYPAYACGVYGLRPSLGRIPTFNPSLAVERTPFVQLSGVQGPLARRIADLRLALKAMAAPDLRDPWWVPVDDGQIAHIGRAGRVALFAHAPGFPSDPVVTNALRQAATWLEEAGHRVEEVSPPEFDTLVQLFIDLTMAEVDMGMRQQVRDYGDPRIRLVIDELAAVARPLDLHSYATGLAMRVTLLRKWSKFFEQYPVMLMPVSWIRPFALDADRTPGAMAALMRAQSTLLPAPVLGLPGLTVPMGLVEGVPTGVQLMAGRFQEARLLAAGEQLESRRGPVRVAEPR